MLAIARQQDRVVLDAFVREMGPATNPDWVVGVCTQEAYERGLIDEDELLQLTR